MEPERKIEKLLRAYAKKRKADAGDAFTLHPATRRRLQAEVDRQFAEPPEEESVSLWQLFRQQWAVLAVFALVIFFGASLFLPALSKAKMKSQNISVMNNLKPTGAAAQIAAVDNRVRLPATLDELTNSHPISAAPAEVASTRREIAEKSDTLAFDQPAPAAAPMALNGINSFGGGGGGGGNTFATKSRDRLVATAAPAAAPAKQLFKDAERPKSEALGVNSNSQRFRNAVANTAPVLVSFELQQNGNNLAVVDADGSVYQGLLQANGPVLQSQLPAVMPPGVAQNEVLDVAKNQGAAGNNFYFRVAGQNRTSRQNVVFTGNLLPLAGGTVNSQAAAQMNNSAAVGEISQTQNAGLLSNSRIAGTATVDTTNQIEINAMPTTP
jgi:hypothetical protein